MGYLSGSLSHTQCRRPRRLTARVQSLHYPGVPKHGEDHRDPLNRVTWPQVKLDPLHWTPLLSALGFADADCSIRAPGKAHPDARSFTQACSRIQAVCSLLTAPAPALLRKHRSQVVTCSLITQHPVQSRVGCCCWDRPPTCSRSSRRAARP